MKTFLRLYLTLAIFWVSNSISAQVYLHPTTGIQGEYVGACLVSTCSGTYRDNGGNSNYSNNINQIYRVFCPNTAGNCLRVTFNGFNVEGGWDFLQVKNGPTQNSPQFLGFPNTATNYAGISGLTGNLNGITPFAFTSTDPSGCLTFRFYSDFVGTAAGWSATFSCVPCANGPNGTDNNDCINATPICSTASITSNASGPGIAAEGCSGSACPAGGENHTNWFTFTVQTGGTLNFVINPDDNNDDYDYAVYGPNSNCTFLGSPIRCSDSGVTGNTGLMNVTPNQNTENVTGDGWTETMNVLAGETYFLVIDEWSPNAGSGYQLSFSGTASLDCTILPIELSMFDTYYHPELDEVELEWATASERNSDFFEIERSTNGVDFEVINTVDAAGNSDMETHYFTVDTDPFVGTNYYRINAWDKDGNGKYSEVRAVNILSDEYDLLDVFPNPTTGITELIYNSYTAGESLLRITTTDGKVVVFAPIDTEKGGNRALIDLSGQDQGMYVIEVITKDKTYKTRLMKN